jgi:purine-binding chemotaxis protein CheW
VSSTSTPASANGSTVDRFCTFFIDGLFFGVDVQKVQEVLRVSEMTRAPLAPPVVAGLINLRGQIVTAIDLRRRLGLRERAGEATAMNVVVRTEESVISLLVDEVGDVLDVSPELFERTPMTFSAVARELVRGVYKLNDQLMLILDIEKAVAVMPAGNRQQQRKTH